MIRDEFLQHIQKLMQLLGDAPATARGGFKNCDGIRNGAGQRDTDERCAA